MGTSHTRMHIIKNDRNASLELLDVFLVFHLFQARWMLVLAFRWAPESQRGQTVPRGAEFGRWSWAEPIAEPACHQCFLLCPVLERDGM